MHWQVRMLRNRAEMAACHTLLRLPLLVQKSFCNLATIQFEFHKNKRAVDHMADVVATDEIFLKELDGLLDLDGLFTPRLSTPKPVECFNRLDDLIYTQGLGSSSPSSTSDSSVKFHNRTRRRENEKNRQRRYRQRIKDSRGELQRQAAELSEHLTELRQKASKRTKTDTSNDLVMRPRWMSEVKEQRERRTQSEAEKKRLIAAVNIQAEYIEALRRVVAKKKTDTSLTCQRNSPTLHSMTSVLYMTYLQQLEDCYARVDNVMDKCGLASMPESTINSVHRRKSDGGVAFFQHLSKISMPYCFAQASRALENMLSELHEPSFDEMARNDNVFIKTRALKDTSSGALAQRCVLRQYTEEERLVLVWKRSSEGEGEFTGLRAEETGRICVEPLEFEVMISVCVQQVPMRFSSAKDHEPAVDKFHNLLNESFEADKQEMTKRVSRLLLEGALAGIDC